MINKVFDTIVRYKLINPGERVIAGLSGGPDSVCLLHVLKNLSERLGAQIFAIHINHMLRGEEADADEAYCRELCGELDVPFYSERVNIARLAEGKGLSLEEAGREARYEQFGIWAVRLGAAKTAVAHNRNDQVETVLMHIIRGAGIDGLKGMDYVRGSLIRPLLDIDRAEIDEYCLINELKPRTDKSNLESVYTRNKIRLELLPYLKECFNPAIAGSILRLSDLAREDAAYLDETACRLYGSCVKKKGEQLTVLDAAMLSGMNAALARRLVRYAIRDTKGDIKGIESNHIKEVLALCSGRTGSELHLPGNLRVRLSYGVLEIFPAQVSEDSDFCAQLRVPGITLVPGAGYRAETAVIMPKNVEQYNNMGYNSLEQVFDYDGLKMGIQMRSRREGDIFKPYGGNGTKKLKEYLIDVKIPRHIRKQLPLLAKNNEIVWIVGHKISDKFKVTENTNTVLSVKLSRL